MICIRKMYCDVIHHDISYKIISSIPTQNTTSQLFVEATSAICYMIMYGFFFFFFLLATINTFN